jgi:hypothetical protein
MAIDLKSNDIVIYTKEIEEVLYQPNISKGLYAEVDFRIAFTDSGVRKILQYVNDDSLSFIDIDAVYVTFLVDVYDNIMIDTDYFVVVIDGIGDNYPVDSSSMITIEEKFYDEFGGKEKFDQYILDNV